MKLKHLLYLFILSLLWAGYHLKNWSGPDCLPAKNSTDTPYGAPSSAIEIAEYILFHFAVLVIFYLGFIVLRFLFRRVRADFNDKSTRL